MTVIRGVLKYPYVSTNCRIIQENRAGSHKAQNELYISSERNLLWFHFIYVLLQKAVLTFSLHEDFMLVPLKGGWDWEHINSFDVPYGEKMTFYPEKIQKESAINHRVQKKKKCKNMPFNQNQISV